MAVSCGDGGILSLAMAFFLQQHSVWCDGSILKKLNLKKQNIKVKLKNVKLREDYFIMDPEKAVEMVDENTIYVAAIFGSTLNGEFKDVERLNDLLMKKNKEIRWDTLIHVDAANGGFIAPFLYP